MIVGLKVPKVREEFEECLGKSEEELKRLCPEQENPGQPDNRKEG